MACEQVHSSDQGYTSPFYDGRYAFNDLDSKEAALAAYEQAIQLSPHAAIFYHHKGHILEQLGRITEAYKAYEEARRLGYSA